MGKSSSVRFVVTMKLAEGAATPSEWKSKYAGPPSDANLRKHIEVFEKSCEKGGCNAHLGPTKVLSAKIVEQATDKIKATYVS